MKVSIAELEELRQLKRAGKLPKLDKRTRRALRIYRRALKLYFAIKRSHKLGVIKCNRSGDLHKPNGDPYFRITVYAIGKIKRRVVERKPFKEAYNKRANREFDLALNFYVRKIEDKRERKIARQLRKLAKIVSEHNAKRIKRRVRKETKKGKLVKRHRDKRRVLRRRR